MMKYQKIFRLIRNTSKIAFQKNKKCVKELKSQRKVDQEVAPDEESTGEKLPDKMLRLLLLLIYLIRKSYDRLVNPTPIGGPRTVEEVAASFEYSACTLRTSDVRPILFPPHALFQTVSNQNEYNDHKNRTKDQVDTTPRKKVDTVKELNREQNLANDGFKQVTDPQLPANPPDGFEQIPRNEEGAQAHLDEVSDLVEEAKNNQTKKPLNKEDKKQHKLHQRGGFTELVDVRVGTIWKTINWIDGDASRQCCVLAHIDIRTYFYSVIRSNNPLFIRDKKNSTRRAVNKAGNPKWLPATAASIVVHERQHIVNFMTDLQNFLANRPPYRIGDMAEANIKRKDKKVRTDLQHTVWALWAAKTNHENNNYPDGPYETTAINEQRDFLKDVPENQQESRVSTILEEDRNALIEEFDELTRIKHQLEPIECPVELAQEGLEAPHPLVSEYL